jgi:hypothetical protein
MGDYVSFTSNNSQQMDFGFFISSRSAEKRAVNTVGYPGERRNKAGISAVVSRGIGKNGRVV